MAMDFSSLGSAAFFAREKKLSDMLESYTGTEIPNIGLEHLRTFFAPFAKKIKAHQTKIVTISGTNGKGETAYTLAHLLVSEGKKVCVWSSPHILSLRERFIINNEFASYDELEEKLSQAISLGLKLTYYEILFYIFCELAVSSECDVIILEVGLGGRKDAVNLLDADLTILTSISRDHTAILGHRFEQILAQKLGVTRRCAPHLSALRSRYLFERQRAQLDGQVATFDLFADGGLSRDVSYRTLNRSLATMAAHFLINDELSYEAARAKVEQKKNWPELKGRFEKMTDGVRTFIFIGAHNTDGFRELTKAVMLEDLKIEHAVLAFSARAMDEIRACLKTAMSELACLQELILTDFDHPRSWKISVMKAEDRDALLNELGQFNKRISVRYKESWKELLDESPANSLQTYLVCGSYYFVGAVERALLERSFYFTQS